MDKIIGFCGLICTDCPAYLAKQNDNNDLRTKTAEEWSKMYGADIKPEHINCEGCTTAGKKIHHWNECQMRICGQEKAVKNCGHCDDYACDKLTEFFGFVPDAKDVLDAEKASR